VGARAGALKAPPLASSKVMQGLVRLCEVLSRYRELPAEANGKTTLNASPTSRRADGTPRAAVPPGPSLTWLAQIWEARPRRRLAAGFRSIKAAAAVKLLEPHEASSWNQRSATWPSNEAV
jgi:hypothetical protein